MICVNCGNKLPEGALFCNVCGNRINKEDDSLKCPKCGSSIISGASFCSECGHNINNNQHPTCPKCGRELIENMPICAYCGFSINGNRNEGQSQNSGFHKNMQNEALKESKYQKLISEFEKTTSKEQFADLADEFIGLGDFGESEKYASLCQAKVEELEKEIQLEKEYDITISNMKNAITEKEFSDIADRFAEMKDYKDSAKLEIECRNIIKKIREEKIEKEYTDAIKAKEEATTESDYSKVADRFSKLKDYKDAEDHLKDCLDSIKRIREEKIEKEYTDAIKAKEEATTESDFSEAADRFAKMNCYKESERLKEECEEQIEKINKDAAYNKAIQLLKTNERKNIVEAEKEFCKLGNWKDAKEYAEKLKKERNKKKTKIIIIACAVVVIAVIGVVAVKMIMEAMKPDLNTKEKMKSVSIHFINYKVPENFEKNKKDSTNILHRYMIKDGDEVIGVVDVEYRGEKNLSGDAKFDNSTIIPTEVRDVIHIPKEKHDTVEIDNSVFQVILFYNKDDVKGADECIGRIINSFDKEGYKNPIVLKSITAEYSGSKKAGTIIDKDSKGLTVIGKYSTGVAEGTAKIKDFTVKPLKLESGKTNTVEINVKNKACKIKIDCNEVSSGQYKKKCKNANYKSLLDEKHYGKLVKISGNVLLDWLDGSYSISSKGDNADAYLVKTEKQLEEGDRVIVYGETDGIYEYKSVNDEIVRIPRIKAKYVEKQK